MPPLSADRKNPGIEATPGRLNGGRKLVTICCSACGKAGGQATHAGLTAMAEANWALVTQGYGFDQCPDCNRRDDEKRFGKLPAWVTIKRHPGFENYAVTVRVEHADVAFAKRILAAVRRLQK